MLETKNLDIIIGTRYLIKNLSFTLNKNDKLAIIGEEGDGKSTLLQCLANNCDYAHIHGTINSHNHKIGYLPQIIKYKGKNLLVKNYLFINDNDYYNKVNLLYHLLNELNIKEDILDNNINLLSGGEKVKIEILKLLLDDSDILLLDEPTNDLDLNTLKWLEAFINSTNKPIVFVSHDETFLSNTANVILHLEQLKKKQECKHTLIKTKYDDYVEARLRHIKHQTQIAYSEKRNLKKQEDKLKQIMSKVEYQQENISRKYPHAAKMLKRKMHSLKHQEKKLENKEITEIPDVEENINFKFDKVFIPKYKPILELINYSLKINNKILSSPINLKVIGDEHLVIIGENGTGKTTLLKEIINILSTRDDITVGYMPQNYDDILSSYKTPIDFLCNNQDKESITKARTFLGNMNFTKEEMMDDINLLSGGSKAKLFLVKLILEQYNALILDEPTRNVSPLSNPIIRNKLKEFTGTIISVSHDRKYIKEVADKVFKLTKRGLIEINKEEL